MKPLCVCGRKGCTGHGRSASNQGWTRYKTEHPERAAYYASSAWRSRRAAQLRANPSCVVCGRKATHADHVRPLAEGGAPDGPLQSMCGPHHRAKTLAESHRGMKRAAARRKRR